VRELGADHVVDYTKGDPFASAVGSYYVVLNAVRDASLTHLRRLLRPGGTVVTLTGIPPQAVLAKVTNLVSSRRTVFMFVQTWGANLEALAKLIEKGQVRPVIEKTYTWNELAEAHRRVETGRVVGKVAVAPPEPRGAA
jgi:NADPH:quinone reductase-like Zn-dependent oxidoreductase